jgi:hypothetical protein
MRIRTYSSLNPKSVSSLSDSDAFARRQYMGRVHTDDLAIEIAHIDNVYLLRLFILCSTVLPTTAFGE